jgi:hypothetical protein
VECAVPDRIIHGDDLLYRFFQEALRSNPQLFSAVPQLLIVTMALWLPLDAYERWPVLLPWVVRDPICRGNPRRGVPDQWSSPNELGFLRDDNSLIKTVPRALRVRGPKGSHLHGARMGSEFVAAHVWRVVSNDRLASRIPLLNSFVPNLVWLPGQVAKLTDREGGVVQQTLQAMSYEIYRRAPVAPHLLDVVEQGWALIPPPAVTPQAFRLEDLNWFETTDRFYRTRSARLAAVIAALSASEQSLPDAERVVTRRYAAGLPLVSADARSKLKSYLQRFLGPDNEDL